MTKHSELSQKFRSLSFWLSGFWWITQRQQTYNSNINNNAICIQNDASIICSNMIDSQHWWIVSHKSDYWHRCWHRWETIMETELSSTEQKCDEMCNFWSDHCSWMKTMKITCEMMMMMIMTTMNNNLLPKLPRLKLRVKRREERRQKINRPVMQKLWYYIICLKIEVFSLDIWLFFALLHISVLYVLLSLPLPHRRGTAFRTVHVLHRLWTLFTLILRPSCFRGLLKCDLWCSHRTITASHSGTEIWCVQVLVLSSVVAPLCMCRKLARIRLSVFDDPCMWLSYVALLFSEIFPVSQDRGHQTVVIFIYHGPDHSKSLWHMASALPDLRSPFQPQSITGTKLYCLVTEALRRWWLIINDMLKCAAGVHV